jgi:hypothetical protein
MRMLTATMASIATITFALFAYALVTHSAPAASQSHAVSP